MASGPQQPVYERSGLSKLSQQTARMNPKSLGDIPDDPNRRVLLTALDATQIPHIDTGRSGELFLTQPLRHA